MADNYMEMNEISYFLVDWNHTDMLGNVVFSIDFMRHKHKEIISIGPVQ